jgi:hypothetical protein
MSGDTLVYDMSSMSEGTPSVFVRKDWLSILDNQNQNYQGNQSTLDTSQLANSNKYLNYREAYFLMPMLITLTSAPTALGTDVTGLDYLFSPATAATSADTAVGLKNWYGSIIHSFTLDYNGTTLVQQTPYIGLWNTFKLMTSLSYQDIVTMGPTIGFYPDTSSSWSYNSEYQASVNGNGVCNNGNGLAAPLVAGSFASPAFYNAGLAKRQQAWTMDVDARPYDSNLPYSSFMTGSYMNQLWKSHIITKTNASATLGAGDIVTSSTAGVWQVAISAIIYLKHVASFFERVPLLKGVFMKLTANLNQSSVQYTVEDSAFMYGASVISPLGGVSPLMITSLAIGNIAINDFQLTSGGSVTYPPDINVLMTVSLAVGGRCLNATQNAYGNVIGNSTLSQSVMLNVPAYTFNPVFESAYLSSPIKKVVFTDVYQYQIVNQIAANQTFNNLISNGIANIKSVLILPFYSAGTAPTSTADGTGNCGLMPMQSPFDCAGGGTTSPLCLFTQFNIQISGQNAIYNTERYSYEQFANQLYGQNSVNAGQTDGISSGLVGLTDFEMKNCYYYVRCDRMLPVEEAVPKSVNILGTSASALPVDLYVFVEYGVEVSIDILTGARV